MGDFHGCDLDNASDEQRDYFWRALRSLDAPLAGLVEIGEITVEACAERVRQRLFRGYGTALLARQIRQMGLTAILMLLGVALKLRDAPGAIGKPNAYLRGAIENTATGCNPLPTLSHAFHRDTVGARQADGSVRTRSASELEQALCWLMDHPDAERDALFKIYRGGAGPRETFSRNVSCPHWKIRAWKDQGRRLRDQKDAQTRVARRMKTPLQKTA